MPFSLVRASLALSSPFGRDQSVDLYSLEGCKEGSPHLRYRDKIIKESNKILHAFYQRDFNAAKNGFQKLYESTGLNAFRILKNQSVKYFNQIPDNGWDGSIRFDSK